MKLEQLKKKIESLGKLSNEQKMSIICSLIGHSKICTFCFGYRNCGRCGELLGDNLGSIDFGNKQAVIIGHNCDACKNNYKKCTWKDKLYCKDPFIDDNEKFPYLLEL